MKKISEVSNSNADSHSKNDTDGLLPNSLKFISTCIRTASSSVRSATASVAASLSGESHEHKDQVIWSSFDRLHMGASSFKCVLLLGYTDGFQVLDTNDATNVTELVSRRDDPATFLQMQPLPETCEGIEGFRSSHPLLIVVADESKSSDPTVTARYGSIRSSSEDPRTGNIGLSPTVVRFYSLRSHDYVHVLRFRWTVYTVRCSPRIIAVGLASQIYCFDALTLENKFSVLSYPVPQSGSQGISAVNIGYGPMAVGTRWLAYASNNSLSSNTNRLSPQNLTPPLINQSTSPSSGNLVAAGLIHLADKGYKALSKYAHDLKHDGSGFLVSSSSSWRDAPIESDVSGTVTVEDFQSRAIISQFKAHTSPISALCFDPSGILLVTASIHGNNINVFQIMPSFTINGSGTRSYAWSSSHVHLYRLHRGMTSAVIQDICFSHFSQRVAIVSSKGTCHIFVLSPLGGENILAIQNSHVHDGPVTLTVVSRIKSNDFFQAATSVFPSGALSAVFHQSVVPNQSQSAHALDYLLVYAPSGHVVQYKLVASDEETRVEVEPVQSWDVCRRTDWPEIEGNMHALTLHDTNVATSDNEGNDIGHEVQTYSGRRPIWQNPKISFYSMNPQEADAEKSNVHQSYGETDIERIYATEIEINRNVPLPAFDDFHGVYSKMGSGTLIGECHPDSSSGSDQVKENPFQGISRSISLKRPVVSISPIATEKDYVDANLAAESERALTSRIHESEASSPNCRSDALDERTPHDSPNFEQFFKEGYYATVESGGSCLPKEIIRAQEISVEDCQDDDDDGTLDGIFSEEGSWAGR